eukprot:CAMPEP_0204327012 /NCGR_PEP_ID=MMETSP0469-20131031/12263_1 /ASSEMBLY_ACC=CAM_ASM_000384 /TAXON_ID=2969 /ORGANISM="Oxyrrhis marina" /LENGTH=114 /DNA_ID=CAMNT_0051309175 /DNA_START=39 /DNA_END=379 /DNA_ORIENTATION=+
MALAQEEAGRWSSYRNTAKPCPQQQKEVCERLAARKPRALPQLPPSAPRAPSTSRPSRPTIKMTGGPPEQAAAYQTIQDLLNEPESVRVAVRAVSGPRKPPVVAMDASSGWETT